MRNFPLLLLLAGLAGCVTLPPMKSLQTELPTTWPEIDANSKSGNQTNPADSIAAEWWRAYASPALDQLMAEALSHNHDLRLAAARIEEARANLGLAEADRFPEVQLGADAGRSKITGKGSTPLPAGTPLANNHFKLNLQAAWEVDLWGRYRAASEAARTEMLASEFARHAIRASLTSAVAQSYFDLAALDANTRLAQNTLANRRDAVNLHRLRFEAGIASELVLRQAEAEQAGIEASLAQLARQTRSRELALAQLLGRQPRAIAEGANLHNGNLFELTLPPAIPAGLPSDLLTRRPDLRQAEQNLLASQARIRNTAAAIYPNLALTANLGSESKALADLFSGPAGIWGLAAGLTQTVFNAGRTEAAVQAAGARQDQALIAYEQTVQTAFKEVLDALVAHRQASESGRAEANRIKALERATELADLRFQRGLSSYLEVLDARRNLFQAEQNGIEARREQLATSAELFKALGGGWEQ